MTTRRTHTLALMELSGIAYQEILTKLRNAEYHHAIAEDGTLDMSGIGVIESVDDSPVTIFGIKYSLQLFQHFASGAIGSTFRIVGRHTGSVTLEIFHPNGYVVDNGKEGADKRYRCMNQYGLVDWTPDQDKGLRFARREDAESFSREDEDAWCITPYVPPVSPQRSDPMQITISTTGFKAEVLERLREPGSGGTLASGPGVTHPNELESRLKHAISDHLKRFASDAGNVSVNCSLTLNYEDLQRANEHAHSSTAPAETSSAKSAAPAAGEKQQQP